MNNLFSIPEEVTPEFVLEAVMESEVDNPFMALLTLFLSPNLTAYITACKLADLGVFTRDQVKEHSMGQDALIIPLREYVTEHKDEILTLSGERYPGLVNKIVEPG